MDPQFTQTQTFGPVVVSWTPGITAGQSTCFVEVQIQSIMVAIGLLSAIDSQLQWNAITVGQATTSGTIVMVAATGTNLNTLMANNLTWNTPQGGEQSVSSLIGTWANS